MKHENVDGTMIFKITEEMLQKIQDWDSCKPVDVTGAKFAYTFVPTGLGVYCKIKVPRISVKMPRKLPT